jgi:hypothetical protein
MGALQQEPASDNYQSRSTIRRTGRLDTPSMPGNGSAFTARSAAAVMAHERMMGGDRAA